MWLSIDNEGQGNLKVIHHFGKHCGDSKSMCAKKTQTTQAWAWVVLGQRYLSLRLWL